jgi:UDP-2,3-diacylglucosamine pyrophosphatase LpxH
MGNRFADYVQFQFEIIRPENNLNERIYVVGDFNGWKVDEKWRLTYDADTKHYKLLTWLRRGVYDYQYVLNNNDWITLEGNGWRTINVYTALLYYRDMRYGGFDRILLASQTKSPGGTTATSR